MSEYAKSLLKLLVDESGSLVIKMIFTTDYTRDCRESIDKE